MVGRLTTGRKAYAAVEGDFVRLTTRAEALRLELRRLADEDAAAFERVGAAYKLPKTTNADKLKRTEATDEALQEAARIPAEVARAAAEVAKLARRAAEAGNKNAASDAATAAALALAAAKGALQNVEINVAGLSRPQSGQARLQGVRDLVRETEESASDAEAAALQRLVKDSK